MIAFDINKWLLADSVIADLLDYPNNEYPILPLQQQPETEGTFVLYDFERDAQNFWLLETVTVSYETWAFSYDEAVAIDQRISRLVASDQSWRRLQDHARANGQGNYSVQDLKYVLSTDLTPPAEEGSRFGRLTVVQVEYTPYDIIYP